MLENDIFWSFVVALFTVLIFRDGVDGVLNKEKHSRSHFIISVGQVVVGVMGVVSIVLILVLGG